MSLSYVNVVACSKDTSSGYTDETAAFFHAEDLGAVAALLPAVRPQLDEPAVGVGGLDADGAAGDDAAAVGAAAGGGLGGGVGYRYSRTASGGVSSC